MKPQPWGEDLKLEWPCVPGCSLSSGLGCVQPSQHLLEELWTPAACGPLYPTLGSWRPSQGAGACPHPQGDLRRTLPKAPMPERWPSKDDEGSPVFSSLSSSRSAQRGQAAVPRSPQQTRARLPSWKTPASGSPAPPHWKAALKFAEHLPPQQVSPEESPGTHPRSRLPLPPPAGTAASPPPPQPEPGWPGCRD